MRLKLTFLSLAFVFLSTNISAAPIDGFDGFKWGTTKSDILRVRADEPIIWGDFEVWEAKDGETVSGFQIKLIGYEFTSGCEDLLDKPLGTCLLWGGTYLLETTSADDIEPLAELLRDKYGDDRTTHEVVQKKDPATGFLYTNINTTRHIWEQPDKSSIELFYKSYDRDFVEKLNEVKKGIFRIGVSYYSPEYTKQAEKKPSLKKSF